MTEEFVFKKLGNILQEECGSMKGVRFLDPKHVKLYDADKKEIEIPKCEYCGANKSQFICRESFISICNCSGAG